MENHLRRQRLSFRLAMAVAAMSMAGTLSTAGAADEPQPLHAIIDTSMGAITVELDAHDAPVTVKNFVQYASQHFYDGTIFHRVIDGFMIQGGGLTPNLQEKPTGRPIHNEANNGLKNVTGTIAMARTEAPDSATAQFFINVADNAFLDHIEVPPEGLTIERRGRPLTLSAAEGSRVYGYAVFGHVVDGMDTVMKIKQVAVHTAGPYENVPVTPVIIRSVKIVP